MHTDDIDNDNTIMDPDMTRVKSFTPRRILSLVVRLSVTIALVVWICQSIDWGIFKQIVISPQPAPLAAFIAFSLFFVFLGGLKLWILLRSFHPMGLWRFSVYFFLASAIGSLIPSIFGDFTLAALMKRSRIAYHKSISIIVLDRFLTLILAVFVFTPVTLVLVLPVSALKIGVLTMVTLITSILVSWLSASMLPRIFNQFATIRDFWGTIGDFIRHDRLSLWMNVGVGFFRGCISGVALAFALMAANLQPALFQTICIANSLAVVTHIPVSISGMGLYEGGGMFLFERIGLQREMVLAGLLYQRAYILIWSVVTIIILGAIILVRRQRRQREDFQERNQPLSELPP